MRSLLGWGFSSMTIARAVHHWTGVNFGPTDLFESMTLQTSWTVYWSLLGVVGMVGFMMLSRAYQIAEASVVAPFDYVYLPMATAMAWAVWGEVPGASTFAGMALITVLAFSKLTEQPMNIAMVEQVLRDLIGSAKIKTVTVEAGVTATG